MRRFPTFAVALTPATVVASTTAASADSPFNTAGAEGPTPISYWMSDHALAVIWTIAIVSVISAVLFFSILRKAGYNPWLSILMLVPPLGLIPMYMLAFRDWPSQSAVPAR